MDDLGCFVRLELIERVARKMYRLAGYNYTSKVSMHDSLHPTERYYWDAAALAVDEVMETIKQQKEMEEEE